MLILDEPLLNFNGITLRTYVSFPFHFPGGESEQTSARAWGERESGGAYSLAVSFPSIQVQKNAC